MSLDRVTRDEKGAWSNAAQDRVDLVDYDPTWPAQYEAEARMIRAALDGLTTFEMTHFGSTAIPRLAAKPIIDIMLVAPDRHAWPRLIEPIKGLGYVYWENNPRRDRMFFVKGMPPFGARRTHHIHVRTPEDARAALVFCDYLRAHPDEAARYAALKQELAARHSTDRDAYTEGKARYVDEIGRRIGCP